MSDVSPRKPGEAVAAGLDVRWSTARAERNLSRVKARLAQRALGAKWGALAALAAAAVALFALFGRGQQAAPARLAQVSASPSSPSPKTTFVDGSVARVSNGGELVVRLATPQRIESALLAGAAEFEVSKRPERDFVVLAGTVQVRVVGTRFRVEQLGERTHVSVSEGKVEVREADAFTYLEAGESRFFPAAAAPVLSQRPPPAEPPSGRARFLELARGGQYKAAYQVMSQSPSVVSSSAEDLMLAADAARLSNHPEQAVGYLRRVTKEHPGDSRAPLAAFTLGRVLLSQLGRPAEAAEAFGLSRRLKPAGSLSEDALAREAEARAASGAGARAAAAAREYLSRYPQGKHGSTMQKLVTHP